MKIFKAIWMTLLALLTIYSCISYFLIGQVTLGILYFIFGSSMIAEAYYNFDKRLGFNVVSTGALLFILIVTYTGGVFHLVAIPSFFILYVLEIVTYLKADNHVSVFKL